MSRYPRSRSRLRSQLSGWLLTCLAACLVLLGLTAPSALAQTAAQAGTGPQTASHAGSGAQTGSRASKGRAAASATPASATTPASAAPATQGPASATGPYGLSAMSDIAQLPQLGLQQRMGHLSSVAPDLSNQDWNNYLYTDSDGGKVIFDEKGPGVLYRLHITLQDPSDANNLHVKVYLDGASTPQIDETIAAMGTGTNAPFLSPLVQDPTVGSGGYTFYLPIPYAKSARVSLSGQQAGLVYWQTDWRSFPAGTPIRTWTGSEDSSQVRALWEDAGAYPDPQSGDVTDAGTTTLPGAGQATVLSDLPGPQELTAIRMKIPGVVPTRGTSESILDDTHIRIYWDGESTPSVDAPLGSFFGMGYFGAAPTRDVMMGMLDDGTMYMYFPMPFARSARIELVNEMQGSGDKPIPGVSYSITHRPFTGSLANVGYFRTAWTPQTVPPAPGPGQPNPKPVHWLNVSGAGQVVGIVESRFSTPTPGRTDRDLGYLEGNVHMWVDGSQTPAWRDNGTEDTFDGGYYFNQGPVENPTSGDNIKTDNSIAAYRTFIGDPIPFRNHITINDQPGGTPPESKPGAVASYLYSTTDFPLVMYYSQQQRMPRSDSFNVGDATAAAQHHYAVTGETKSYSLSSTYDSYLHPPQVTGQVNAEQGSSQFTLRTDPRNQGVVLRRTYDQAVGRQDADVYVDGKLVGPWYQAYGNDVSRWAQDDFTIPAADTSGKSSISVQLRWVSGSPPWTEAAYSSYSILPPAGPGQFRVPPPAGSTLASMDTPPTLTDGTPSTLTGTFYNATNAPDAHARFTLQAPSGWTVTPASPMPPVVGPHQAVRLAWHVTAPAGTSASPGLTLHARYDTAGGPASVNSAPVATTAKPAIQVTSFSASPNTAKPGQQATFEAQVSNLGSRSYSGTLSIGGPSGWTLTPANRSFTLAAGAVHTFTATTTNPGTEGQPLTFTASTTYASGGSGGAGGGSGGGSGGEVPGGKATTTLFTGHLRCLLGDTDEPVWHADPGYSCTLDQGYQYYDPTHSTWPATAPANYCWCENPPQSLLFHVTVPKAASGTLRLFLVDGDGYQGGRSETVYVDGHDEGTYSDFQQGKWVTADLTSAQTASGRIEVKVVNARQGSNVVVSEADF
ncbi:MAG: DUF2961 domain-containing protein [Nocardiopsaceae bacterium]|nr:DUF2961 domain-containing protein [Nocardiopsaceae bacterium]